MGVLIGAAWDQVKGEVPAWREKVGDAPALIAALGRKYAELKEYGEAEKYLRQYIEISPDPWAYRSLADATRPAARRDRWQATLDEFLANTEPAGLEHAKLQVEIANDLMKRGRWADAKKYAEPAAETWAGWAMTCASECNEGLKDWERAELWIRRTAERYPQANGASWYRFCKRTGHGDIQAARAFSEAHVPGAADRPDPARLVQDGFSLWAKGSTKEALDSLEQAERARPTPANAIAAFLLADELGDKARRDRLLEELCTKLQRQVPRMVTIGRMMRDALADGGKGSLDLAAVEKVLRDMPVRDPGERRIPRRPVPAQSRPGGIRPEVPPACRRQEPDVPGSQADRERFRASTGSQAGTMSRIRNRDETFDGSNRATDGPDSRTVRLWIHQLFI